MDDGPRLGRSPAPRTVAPSGGTPAGDPLAEAMAELRGEFPAGADEGDDRYWLRVGLAVGLGRPGHGRLLLDRLEGAAAGEAGAPGEADEAGAPGAAAAADESAEGPDAVPLLSRLLARAAVLPLDTPADTAFGWASRLTAGQVAALGHAVERRIAAGAPRDLARGFGLAWTGGVRLPPDELNGLFVRFTELEVAVASVLSGHDVREAASRARPSLSDTIQSWFMPRAGADTGQAGAILDEHGAPAQHGLIAAWNAWAAVRYRAALPDATFDQLTGPWAEAVGAIPLAEPRETAP